MMKEGSGQERANGSTKGTEGAVTHGNKEGNFVFFLVPFPNVNPPPSRILPLACLCLCPSFLFSPLWVLIGYSYFPMLDSILAVLQITRCISAPQLEAEDAFKLSLTFNQTNRCHFPKECCLHIFYNEILRSHLQPGIASVQCCLTVFAVVFDVSQCSLVCLLRNVCTVFNIKHRNFTY